MASSPPQKPKRANREERNREDRITARRAGRRIDNSNGGDVARPGAIGIWWQDDPKDMLRIFPVQLSAADPRTPVRAFQEAGYHAIDD